MTISACIYLYLYQIPLGASINYVGRKDFTNFWPPLIAKHRHLSDTHATNNPPAPLRLSKTLKYAILSTKIAHETAEITENRHLVGILIIITPFGSNWNIFAENQNFREALCSKRVDPLRGFYINEIVLNSFWNIILYEGPKLIYLA